MKEKSFYIHTLGCQQNKSDSERVASVFKHLGIKETDSEHTADFVVVNSCAVRQTSMDRIYGKLRHWRPRQQKGELKTILTGCILQHDRDRLGKEFDYIVNLEDIPKIPEIIGEGEALDLKDYFSVTPKHESEFKAFVPIMTGCDKFCTYCAVPYTRGREISRPVNDILQEVRGLITKGYKEIFLLGQNVNSYAGMMDKKQDKRGLLVLGRKMGKEVEHVNFAKLLAMVAEIPGDFWIRYTTSHPYDMSDELIETMAKYDKIVNYVNLPVQSGDETVLKSMNRHYTIPHYLGRLQKIRETLKPVSITTDIIVGFPGETEEQFNNTAEFMKQVEYDMAFINQYSPRPGTVAERKFEDAIPKEEKKRRDKYLNEILKETALKHNQALMGQTIKVLVDEVKEGENGLMVNKGRNDLFKPVQFEAARSYLGQFVEVKVVEVGPWSLKGELV